MISTRLPITTDPALLQGDLERLRSVPQSPQPGPYHDGDWTGLPLYDQGGDRPGEEYPFLYDYAPTEALALAPYLASVLDRLECPKLLVRLLTLPPDSDIGVHNDAGSNFQFGSLRLHVPIVTHPDVVMMIDDERQRWVPGEMWWGDFSRAHWLRNDSDVTRVHLVIDVQVNDFVLGLFPPALVAEKEAAGKGISRFRPPLPAERRTTAELAPFAADFTVPAPLMPIFGGNGGLGDLVGGGAAQCRPDGAGRLLVTLDGRPAFALVRTDDRRFSVVGQPPGVFVEFDDADRPRTATVVLRGLPEDLYAAQLGFLQGPVIGERRFDLELVPVPVPVE